MNRNFIKISTLIFKKRYSPRSPNVCKLFILMLENLILIKKHPKIKGIEIFEHYFLYTAYRDDTTFFLKDSQSIAYLFDLFNIFCFFFFSRLKPNLTKCKIAGIVGLKGVQLGVCSAKCIDLCNKAIKILGTYFSYNDKIKEESNFLKVVFNVQTVL